MNPNFDMYFDNPSNRSPNSQRHNGSLHRQGSRNQFEAPHGYLPSGLYTAEDHARYEPTRFGGDMRNATIGGYGGGYDMGGQSWNANSFNANHSLNGLGGPGLRKPPSRGGRSNLPSVRINLLFEIVCSLNYIAVLAGSAANYAYESDESIHGWPGWDEWPNAPRSDDQRAR